MRPLDPNSSIIRVPVNCDLSLEVMLMQCAFDHCNRYVNGENFSIVGAGTKETDIHLLNFGVRLYSPEIDEWLDENGFVSMRIEHHLALSHRDPDLQRKITIVERGSAWVRPNGAKQVLYTNGTATKRNLHMLPDFLSGGGGWLEDCYFGAIRRAA